LKDPKVFGYSIAVGGGMAILGAIGAWHIHKSILADEVIYNQRRQEMVEQGMATGVIPKEGLEMTEDGKPVPGPMATKEQEEAYMRGMADLEAQNRESFFDRVFNNMGTFWHDRVLSTKVGGAIFNNPVTRVIGYGSQYKVHDVLNEKRTNFDTTVANIWETAEVFEPKTERVFRYLQVFTACVMSFAHGSNDVANAVGPYSAIYTIWSTGKVPSKTDVETWILALGGAGIVLGLATFGYKIMRVLGVKAVKVTNARGFCMELATASTVILASRYGLPISTTQAITGAVLAVGVFEGAKGVNWRMFARIFTGWVFTLVIAGFVSAGIAAWGVYSPSKICADDSVAVIKALDTQTLKMIKELNTTSGVSATVTSQLMGLNNTLTTFYKNAYNSPPAVSSLNTQVFTLFNSSICHN
jgi:phosphate/sulfate permease